MELMYYRPQWTCGRYNELKNVALIYNLIEGVSYFFEDYSAVIVNEILCTEKVQRIRVANIIKDLPFTEEEIVAFLDELVSYGLVLRFVPDGLFVKEYRDRVASLRQKGANVSVSYIGKSDNAERAYSEACGDSCIGSVMFELTYRCSEQCVHCYNPGATRNDTEKSYRGDRLELTFGDYKNIIDELYELGLYKVCLSGGDPFSKSIVWDLIEYLNEKGIAFDVFTNGLSIVDKIEKLANFYPRVIGISLYSNIEHVHDTITRTNGSYLKTISVIEQCAKFGIPMNIKCCIMLPNLKSYTTVKELAAQYGAIPQFDLNITDSIEGDKCASRYLRLPSEIMELVLRDRDIPYYINATGIITKKEYSICLSEKICNAGFDSLCITPEGYIQPCCAFPLYIGSAKEGFIGKQIENSVKLQWWRKQRFGNLEECHKHDYCVYCQLCPGNNFIASGTPLKPSENNCTLAITRYKLAQKMQKGYDPLCGKTLEEKLAEINIGGLDLHREESINYRNTIDRIDEVS